MVYVKQHMERDEKNLVLFNIACSTGIYNRIGTYMKTLCR